MSQLSNIKNVKEILARHGFTFSKKLGQNFIVNPSICPRIAELGGAGPDTGVLEIGPGLGVLTWELAARAPQGVAVWQPRTWLPAPGRLSPSNWTSDFCRYWEKLWQDLITSRSYRQMC